MARRGEFKTVTDDVYSSIREEILSGALQPGQRLRVAQLSERFDVSANVTREALTRLSAQHLVVSEPQRGFAVMSLSVDSLRDLTLTRQVVDGLAMKLAIERGDMKWETDLLTAHHRLSATPRSEAERASGQMPARWSAIHADFHRTLLAGCGADHLNMISQGLYDASEVYRRWSVPAAKKRRNPMKEHQRIMTAALERDVPTAVKLLTEHLALTAAILISYPDESVG